MSSTYSPALRLELMATGDQSGTWGDTTNTNLGTLLEQAITGYLSVAQGDVANLTLTALDGAADQARNAMIDITGALTAGRNVVVPTAEKLYFFRNLTTGGFAITVKTAAGTGITVPPNTGRWLVCDGTNVVDMYATALVPSANDNASLGLSGTAWSDAYFASGAILNFNAGNYTITHSAGNLAFSGAITLGTDLAILQGGTGASTAAGARTNLETNMQFGSSIAAPGLSELEFTGIPAGVNRIIISFSNISTSGVATPEIILGDSGGYEFSGYLGTAAVITSGASPTASNHSGSFLLGFSVVWAATYVLQGFLELTRLTSGGFSFQLGGNLGRSDAAVIHSIGGTKALSADLDRLKIFVSTGTFDAGTVNISYSY